MDYDPLSPYLSRPDPNNPSNQPTMPRLNPGAPATPANSAFQSSFDAGPASGASGVDANYTKWLSNVKDNYHPITRDAENTLYKTPGAVGQYAEADDVGAMLNATGGDTLLSPFFRAMLKGNAANIRTGAELSDLYGGLQPNARSYQQELKDWVTNWAQPGGAGQAYQGVEDPSVRRRLSNDFLDEVTAGGTPDAQPMTSRFGNQLSGAQLQQMYKHFSDVGQRERLLSMIGFGMNSPYASELIGNLRAGLQSAEQGSSGSQAFLDAIKKWRDASGMTSNVAQGAPVAPLPVGPTPPEEPGQFLFDTRRYYQGS